MRKARPKKKKTAKKRRTKAELLSQISPLLQFARNQREKLGYTQEQLAHRSGLNPRFVREFERGKRTVRLDKVVQLLEFLGAELKPIPRASL